MRKQKALIALVVLLTFVSGAFAEQIQFNPVSPLNLPSANPGTSTQAQGPGEKNLNVKQVSPKEAAFPKPASSKTTPPPTGPLNISKSPGTGPGNTDGLDAGAKRAAEPTTDIPTVKSLAEVSQLEQQIFGKISQVVSTDIRQFGYDLFRQSSSIFAPATEVPVGPDYVIGPGDELKITAWGQIEGQWTTVVDRDGTIGLPKVGTIGVAGLNFKELKETLFKEFRKYYKGFEMNVSMGALRTMRIYVVGNAVKPGSYTVSALSTLISAIFEAGGPAKTGTMRNIQLKRSGKTIVTLDLYDFLMKGDKSKDLRLMPDDVIFMPPIGPVAGIAGNVKVPAIYELNGETRITDLIAMAGGITATGYLQRVQAERVFENEAKIITDTNLKEIDKEKDIIVKDLDIVKIFPISNVIINAVTLQGNVSRPGQVQWFEGMRISDIIKDTEKDLLPETYFDYALVERYIPPDYHKEIISLNLGKALFERDKKEDRLLKPYDTLTIYSKWEFLERPVVRIAGAVNRSGDFELKGKMRISDLLKAAGGTKYFAFLDKAELTRVKPTPEGPKTETFFVNITKVLEGDPASDLSLFANDYLLVRTVPEWRLYRQVTISGEVKFPGTYAIQKGEALSGLIERAGGYTDRAYLRGALFMRDSVRELQQKSLSEMTSRLERELLAQSTVQASTALSKEEADSKRLELESKQKFVESLKTLKASGRMVLGLTHLRLLKGTEFDIELEDGDTLMIPEVNKVINVTGAVMSAGSYIYVDKLNYQDYIAKAGGFSNFADEDSIYVLKADGSARKISRSFLDWNGGQSRWELAAFKEKVKELEPGDSIIVPEKLERVAWLRNIKDITQILMQIAVVAGVTVNLF